MIKGVVLLTCFISSACWTSSLYGAEEMTAARVAYRQSTLEALVLESQHAGNTPQSDETPYSQNTSADLSTAKDSLFTLEPANDAVGNVVGA